MDQFGILGWHAPVAIGVAGHDVVLDERAHEIDPLHHGGIGSDNHFAITVLLVERTRDDHQTAGPGDVIAVDRPIGRTDVGHTAGILLSVDHILDPFGIQRSVLEQERLALGLDRSIAEPALSFIALRAVGRHAAVVAA